MKTAGFICELNPLHEGHRHFISQARANSGAEYLIAVMSGDYVQRGEPAILPMHLRARMALEAGADLVLELPAAWATASAAYFAEGGVRLLHALGCVDSICFGAECADDQILCQLADFLYNHDDRLQPLIRRYVSEGMTYASARSQAVSVCASEDPCLCETISADTLSSVLKAPNNQLGLAYLQAVRSIGSSLKPCVIPRDLSYKSSSEIRQAVFSQSSSFFSDKTLPEPYPALAADDFSVLLKDRLLRMTDSDLTGIFDVTPDLAHRIKNRQNAFLSWSQFTDLLHTKEMSRARISRSLTHVLLDIRKDHPLLSGALPRFVRVLGFRRSASPLLAELKDSASIPLVTSLPPEANDYAADLYQSVLTNRYGIAFVESHEQPVVVI